MNLFLSLAISYAIALFFVIGKPLPKTKLELILLVIVFAVLVNFLSSAFYVFLNKANPPDDGAI